MYTGELKSYKKKSIVIKLIIASLIIINLACDDNRKETVNINAVQENKSQREELSSIIPNDVKYSIIKTDVLHNFKRSLDVRLNRRVTKDVLRSIALKLKSEDPKNYERTFISYVLPKMVVNSGAWATTHFNPSLEIKILGLTIEQAENILKDTKDSSRKVIGSWLDERPFSSNKITIYLQNEKLYMEQRFPDGTSSNSEIIENKSSDGRRFQDKEGSDFGDYYLIDRQDNLQIRDQEGLIATAIKIK